MYEEISNETYEEMCKDCLVRWQCKDCSVREWVIRERHRKKDKESLEEHNHLLHKIKSNHPTLTDKMLKDILYRFTYKKYFRTPKGKAILTLSEILGVTE